MTTIEPFAIDVPAADIDDLNRRLAQTRWPDAETPDDWSQGVPLAYAQKFCRYWAEGYDWSARQALMNRFAQFKTTIEDLDIHFIHHPSPSPEARPLLITHGWPGSVVEFHKVIEPLADPAAHGGDPADAFHVICPSLPGYGFSGKPAATGWGVEEDSPRAWDELMARLGYDGYFAQGGDWGGGPSPPSSASRTLGRCGRHSPQHCPSQRPPPRALSDPTDRDKQALAGASYYQEWDSGYSKQQSTRPQTLGYGLVDSARRTGHVDLGEGSGPGRIATAIRKRRSAAMS